MNMTTKLCRRADIMAADMNGSTVMLDVTTGKYYNLGEVGGAIWALLEQPMTLEELVNELVRQYKVSPEQCRRDTLPFVEKLAERGLLTEA